MPADLKISQFTEQLLNALDGTEWLGGYKEDTPNDNIRVNIVALVLAILDEIGIPGLDEVLAQFNETDGSDIVVSDGDATDYRTLIGPIMYFAGPATDERLINLAGNLLLKAGTWGMTTDGSTYTTRMNSDGTVQAKSYYTTQLVLTYGSTTTWSWLLGDDATLTLTGDTIMDFTDLRHGTKNLIIIQGGSGGHLIDWNSLVKWRGDTEPVLSTDAGKYDIVSLIYDGTNITGTAIIGYTL